MTEAAWRGGVTKEDGGIMAKRKSAAAKGEGDAVVEQRKDTVPEADELEGEGLEPSADGRYAEYLGFMIADEEYALDILEIKEIIRLQNITVVPRTPEYLKGIITLRGVIVPVFDLRRRLGLDEAEHSAKTRIVVVYRGEEFAGLIVDAITQVMKVDLEAIEPTPPTIGVVEAEYIKGVTHHRDRLVILLNLARVLDVTS
jgi:purine-binding chemotaxis protein CheW